MQQFFAISLHYNMEKFTIILQTHCMIILHRLEAMSSADHNHCTTVLVLYTPNAKEGVREGTLLKLFYPPSTPSC